MVFPFHFTSQIEMMNDTYLKKERIKRRYCDYCRADTRQTLHDKLLLLIVRANRSTKQRNKKENREKTECTITYDDLKDQTVNQQGRCFYSRINMSWITNLRDMRMNERKYIESPKSVNM